MKWGFIALLMLGCGVTELEEKETDSAEDTTIESDGVSPTVLEADAWCYNLEETEKWTFTAQVEVCRFGMYPRMRRGSEQGRGGDCDRRRMESVCWR